MERLRSPSSHPQGKRRETDLCFGLAFIVFMSRLVIVTPVFVFIPILRIWYLWNERKNSEKVYPTAVKHLYLFHLFFAPECLTLDEPTRRLHYNRQIIIDWDQSDQLIFRFPNGYGAITFRIHGMRSHRRMIIIEWNVPSVPMVCSMKASSNKK